MPKISLVIPIHLIPLTGFFLGRCLESVRRQTYKNYEVIISAEGLMAENTNAAIKRAKGEIVKILFMDDYLAHKDSLQEIADNFQGGWLVSGCLHDNGQQVSNAHYPLYNDQIHTGENTIGSPSVLAFENKDPLLFDETMSWLLDCDLYKRLHQRYGEPTILNTLNVVIGIGAHQVTHTLSDEEKKREYNYMQAKYV